MTTVSPAIPPGHRFAHLLNARRWLCALNDDRVDDIARAVGRAAFDHPTGRVEAEKLATELGVTEHRIWQAVDTLVELKFAKLFENDDLFLNLSNNRVQAAAKRVARRNGTDIYGAFSRAANRPA